MLASTKTTVNRIRGLKIQGAEAVAEAALGAFANESKKFQAASPSQLISHLHSVSLALKNARPTEPALRNSLRFVFARAKASKAGSVERLKHSILHDVTFYEKKSLENKKLIAEYGARLVPRNGSVLIHCHSSTVMRILKKAHDSGKRFKVYCTESRPLYQGRISAKELSAYGLDVMLAIDNAVSSVLHEMRDSDIVLAGADAVTAQGDLINKIGTAGIAVLARENHVKFYACTSLHKFDPLTFDGSEEPIEQRSAEEVLPKAEARRMPKVKVLNPAFDLTPARFITAFVTEAGVIPPGALLGEAEREYGVDLRKKW